MSSDPPPASLRIGTLGAARITPAALLRPARSVAAVEVAAVAARERERARRFAEKHGIPRVHDDYQSLIADPDLDAIYNPLPNSHHCVWTIRALEAGKHVLCEKPMAANADEARKMADAAERSGRILMEAFHWRYHPLADRMRERIDDGAIGRVTRVETTMCVPMILPGDIRYRHALAGGATMDVGAYTVNVARFLAGSEPSVTRATAQLASRDVDRAMEAELAFADGVTGRVRHSLFSRRLVAVSARVVGDAGELRVFNPYMPQLYHRLTVVGPNGQQRERVEGEPSYTGQLRAFAQAVESGVAPPTDGVDAVRNMAVIDDIYRKAGMKPRGT